MENNIRKTWSHTQFEKFTACPRRYYYNYILDKKDMDRAGIEAQFSAALVHPMLAAMYMGNPVIELAQVYDAWIVEVGTTVSLQTQFSLTTLQKVIALYKQIVSADLMQYTVRETEPRLVVKLHDVEVIVKPDVVLLGENGPIPLDFKVSGHDQPKNRLPYANQFVGQCIAVGADRYFCDNITIAKNGKIWRVREAVLVSEELKEEWCTEQEIVINERNRQHFFNIWPKHSQNCYQFNKPCPFILACSAGRTYGEELL